VPIRLALIIDYEVVVRGLAEMLSDYDDHVEVVELDANVPVVSSVDIALYDTFAQDQSSPRSVRDLVDNPHIDRVVVYSWNTEEHLVRSSFANGAHGYLSKTMPAEDLVAALRAVHEGEKVFPLSRRGRSLPPGNWPGRSEGLTPREAEVLALITQGLSNLEIVHRSGLSINSIKSYIRTAYRKIGVTSRSQAVLWGVEHGMRPDRERVVASDTGS
jgi:DNA-binding NarL/FixJ family response regulator